MPWNPEVDLCWHTLVGGASAECEPEWCDSEDPLFILYTSGSTGRPKVTTNAKLFMLIYSDAITFLNCRAALPPLTTRGRDWDFLFVCLCE